MARVTLENVRKVYDNGFAAVHDATFVVEDGEFIVLVGPSGCGKSTTLRMIAGLESITDGSVSIGNRVVNDVPPKDRDIAMVFQNYALYPHMSVYDNMAFGLKLRKFAKQEIKERVARASEILGIEAILDRKPKQLSGGQSQRVAVGRAIVRDPHVFLFDEPLSNLDAKLRVQMRSEITKLHRQLNATMIYVTHDQIEAMTMGDRIVVMNEGHIQQIDTPLRLYNYPNNRFVAGFIGSPAMNFAEGTVIKNGSLAFRERNGAFVLPLPDGVDDALSPFQNGSVTLGIRPEDIHQTEDRHIEGLTANVDLQLDEIEPMGNEVFVHAKRGDLTVTARLSPRPLPELGETVRLVFDLEKLHFFDSETHKAIRSDTGSVAAA